MKHKITQKIVFKPLIRRVQEPYHGTLSVSLPKEFAQSLGLHKECHVQIELESNAIIIRKAVILPKRKEKKERKTDG